jgi:site-specific recombinase XerD
MIDSKSKKQVSVEMAVIEKTIRASGTWILIVLTCTRSQLPKRKGTFVKGDKNMGNIIPMGNRQLSRAFSREIPKYFTSDEIHRILSDELKEKHYSAWFLCKFLWNTGTRISEAVSVKTGFFNSTERQPIIMYGKHVR